jgi:uncharacterized protein YggL (DUF469 family)
MFRRSLKKAITISDFQGFQGFGAAWKFESVVALKNSL